MEGGPVAHGSFPSRVIYDLFFITKASSVGAVNVAAVIGVCAFNLASHIKSNIIYTTLQLLSVLLLRVVLLLLLLLLLCVQSW